MDVQAMLRAAIENDARSQRELAEVSGIHFVNLSRFAAGKKSLTVESLEALAKALGLEMGLIDVSKKGPAKKKR